MDSSISLNKFISDTGYCSRREADNLIKEGRVLINDQIAQMGNRYDVGDIVEVDGSIIKAPKKDKLIYIALYKPAGITTTSESHIPGFRYLVGILFLQFLALGQIGGLDLAKIIDGVFHGFVRAFQPVNFRLPDPVNQFLAVLDNVAG